MKIHNSVALVALVICFCLAGTMLSGKDDEFREVTAFNSKLPIYHKNRLQFVVSCKTMQRQADKINATDAVIDIIRKGANIDRIQYLNVLIPYPLGAPLPTVVDFWKDRLYSEAIISSTSAQIDQENKTANGTEKVYLRSPALDLNGIGFLANYDKRTVLVRKDVNIVVRLAVAKTRNLTAKTLKQAKDDAVRITSETLFVDFDKNLITLQGKVRINEARFSIDSDEVQLLLSGNEDKNKNVASDEESQIQGVSKVTCIGNVVITKTVSADELQKNGEQKATAGKAVYEVKDGQIVLTENRPQIKRGNDTVSGSKITIWKETERMLVEKDGKIVVTVPRKDKKTGKPEANKTPTIVFADFMDINYGKNIATLTGNVKVDDTMLKLDCHKMTIYLEDAKNQGKKAEPATDAKKIADDGLDFNRIAKSNSRKDISQIICVGDVIIYRKTATDKNGVEEKALAGEAVYNLKESKIILSKDNPIIIRGRDSISGRKVTVWVNQERMVVDKNSKIILSSMRTGEFKQAAGKASTIVTSDVADLNYGKNVLSFDGKVQVQNPQMSLDCQQMKIFMEEKQQDNVSQIKDKEPADSSADPFNNLQNNGKKKEVSKVVCTGNVLVNDPRAILNCDKMTILMRDKLKKNDKSKVEDSPFGAGSGREIYELLCDGNVRIENKPDKSEQKAVAPAEEKIEGVQSVLKAKSIGKSFVTADNAILKIADNYAELLGKVKIDEPRMNLTCQKMMIYGKEMTAGKKPEVEEIEDEPFEGEVPRQISLGANKELTKIICLKDVIINRKTLEEEKQRATGEKAVYTVDQRKIVLSGDDKNFPTMQRGETAMEGDEITLWTNSEKLDIKNGRLKQAEKLK